MTKSHVANLIQTLAYVIGDEPDNRIFGGTYSVLITLSRAINDGSDWEMGRMCLEYSRKRADLLKSARNGAQP